MTALILALVAQQLNPAPKILWRTFDPFDEGSPLLAEEAMQTAQSQPRLTKYEKSILSLFSKPSGKKTNRLAGIRLAIQFGSRWLFVDEVGRGYDDGYCTFDAEGWERLIRQHSDLNFLRSSAQIKFFIRNETTHGLEYSNVLGSRKGSIAPNKTIGFTTLCWSYTIFAGNVALVQVPRFFNGAVQLSEGIAFRFEQFGPFWKLRKGTPAAKLIVRQLAPRPAERHGGSSPRSR